MFMNPFSESACAHSLPACLTCMNYHRYISLEVHLLPSKYIHFLGTLASGPPICKLLYNSSYLEILTYVFCVFTWGLFSHPNETTEWWSSQWSSGCSSVGGHKLIIINAIGEIKNLPSPDLSAWLPILSCEPTSHILLTQQFRLCRPVSANVSNEYKHAPCRHPSTVKKKPRLHTQSTGTMGISWGKVAGFRRLKEGQVNGGEQGATTCCKPKSKGKEVMVGVEIVCPCAMCPADLDAIRNTTLRISGCAMTCPTCHVHR